MLTIYGVDGMNGIGRLNNCQLGAAVALIKGVDFDCKTACWGNKGNHELFKNLQSAVNRFSTKLGFKPIVVDGFIGANTVTAVARVLSDVVPFDSAVLNQNMASSKETVAANAPLLHSEFVRIAAIDVLPSVPAPKPTPSETKATEKTVAEKAAAEKTAAGKVAVGKDRGWLWWLFGGVAVVGIGTVAYMTWKKKKEGAEEEPSHAGRYPTQRVRTPAFMGGHFGRGHFGRPRRYGVGGLPPRRRNGVSGLGRGPRRRRPRFA